MNFISDSLADSTTLEDCQLAILDSRELAQRIARCKLELFRRLH